MRHFLLFCHFVTLTFASFCGDSAIPYSFEALEDGQPILGCARPTCFGWNAQDDADFNSINGKQDGFFREEKLKLQETFLDGQRRTSQNAVCEENFYSTNCNGDDQWVGGVAPLMNVVKYPTLLKCCTYEPLRLSTDRGVATVQRGEFVVGGEVTRNGLQYAFDYISDLTKVVNEDGTITYEVNMKRFPCLPVPTKKTSDTYLSKTPEAKSEIRRVKREDPVVNHPGHTEPTVAPTSTTTTTTAKPTTTTEEPDYVPDLPEEEDPTPRPPRVHRPRPRPVEPDQPISSGMPKMSCFSGDTMVQVMNYGPKRMDQLNTNDWVLSVNETESIYIPLLFWLHKSEKVETEFIRLDLDDRSHLKLTEQHFIFKTDCSTESEVEFSEISGEAVFAENVHEGDCLYSLVTESKVVKSKVLKVSRVKEVGIYAPMTSNGKIVVNSILASCHSIIQSHTIQTTFFGYIHRLSSAYHQLFGYSSAVEEELPLGMNLLVHMMHYILPKNLVTM